MDEKNNELLPCPFCGCHATNLISYAAVQNRHTIKCEDCPGRAEFFSSTREQAVEAWNRRATPASSAPGGEACTHCGRAPGDRRDECESCPDHAAAPDSAQQGKTSLRHSEAYVSDLEDSLKQIAGMLGVTGGADDLIAAVKKLTAQQGERVIEVQPGHAFIAPPGTIVLHVADQDAQQVEACKRCGGEDMIYVDDTMVPCPDCQDLSDYDDDVASAQQGEDEPPLPFYNPERALAENWTLTARAVKKYGDARAAHAVAHMMRKLGDGVNIGDDPEFVELARAYRKTPTGATYRAMCAYIDAWHTAKLAQARAAGAAIPELSKAFVTLESHGNEGCTIVLKFNNRNNAYAVHDFLLKGGGRGYSAAGAERAVPEGWKLVPVEPTDDMRTACKVLNYADDIDAEWSRMLAAAPSPAAAKEGQDSAQVAGKDGA